MTTPNPVKHNEFVQKSLEQVIDLLQKHHLVENLVHNQSMRRHELVENLVHKQHINELRKKLDSLHPADVAYILESLPLDQRLVVWELVKAERDGEILIEVSDAVRESLIANMDTDELIAATEHLDTDEIADLAQDLPDDVVEELMRSLDAENRAEVQSALSYPEHAVGAHMDFDTVTIREDVTLETVLRYLRRKGEMPDQTDKIFVVDRQDYLRGIVSLKKLVLNPSEMLVKDVMATEIVFFHPEDDAAEAAKAFERYDLISVPIVDTQHRLIGRLTIDAVIDLIREESNTEVLNMAGLKEEEDLFAGIWRSAQNRWTWIAINLVTAFTSSRVIGHFEDTIEKLVALATLMPIVAGIGGNTGNQTSTLIVRALALGQINATNTVPLIIKEIVIGALNGLIWGAVMGGITFALYQNIKLGLVMMAAMFLNLLLAAIMGLAIPLVMTRVGRDPAIGNSVLLTAMTDSMGFFIFLGLATVFLI